MKKFTETLVKNSDPAFNLSSLGQMIFDLDAKCSDKIMPEFKNARVVFEDNTFQLRYTTDLDVEMTNELSDYAMSQLCLKAGVPAQYVNKCIEKQEDWATNLVLSNLNEWIKRSETENVLVRLYDTSVRGLLSAKYICFDAPEIFEGLTRGFAGNHDYAIKNYLVSPERFHVRMVKTSEIEGLSDLYAGFIINSSDVGRFAITINYFVYKKICTNGLMIPYKSGPKFRQIHLGSIKEIEDAVKLAIQYMPEYEKTVAEFITNAEQVDYAEVLADPESQAFQNFFTMIKTQTGLSGKSVENVIDLMQTRYGTTNWALVNAITEEAQKYTLDRRMLLEKAAGNILLAA